MREFGIGGTDIFYSTGRTMCVDITLRPLLPRPHISHLPTGKTSDLQPGDLVYGNEIVRPVMMKKKNIFIWEFSFFFPKIGFLLLTCIRNLHFLIFRSSQL